jgi:hypothetical protein
VIVSRGLGLGPASGALVAGGLGLLSGITTAPGGTITTRGLGLSPYHGALSASGLGVGEAGPPAPAAGGSAIVTRGLGLTPYHGSLAAAGLGLGEAEYVPEPPVDPVPSAAYDDIGGEEYWPVRKKKVPPKEEVVVLDLTLALADDRDLLELLPLIARMMQ